MLTGARGVVLFLTVLIALVSALSAIESNEWWIRIWDFPRLQILAVAAVLLAAAFGLRHRRRLPIAAVLAFASAWQLYRIYPYTPLAPTEIAIVDADKLDAASCFSALSLNVYQKNRDYARTERLLARENPDLLILLETDRRWASALKGRLDSYPTVTGRPLDDRWTTPMGSSSRPV